MIDKNILKTLDDGLILRTATPEDEEPLAQFNGKIHADPGETFVEHIARWTRDLFSGAHPTCAPGDFTIVEDTTTGEIVSTLCYIGQTWAYEGIQFSVGRPELVGTLAAYRRRGLVREQFDVIHQWGQERGHKLQFITGIPWYYRQFGYEMAVNLGGRRQGMVHNIPELKQDEEEPFRFRPATGDDIPFITDLDVTNNRRNLLTCVRDETLWKYELSGRTPGASMQVDLHLITGVEGDLAGYFTTVPILLGGGLHLNHVEIKAGVSWFEVAHSLLRQLKVIGGEYARRDSSDEKSIVMSTYAFGLGEDHPLYHVVPNRMPQVHDPYAYYIRVPDLPGFLKMIVPVLEERLANSYMSGHSGALKLNFYQSGIEIVFEKGKLKTVEAWTNPNHEDASANFPGLTFLQLLFGYRDVSQLEDAFPDVYYPKEEAKYLLGALFPRKPSCVVAFA